jgi:succinoglycan biosynthesis transport protein ExoP
MTEPRKTSRFSAPVDTAVVSRTHGEVTSRPAWFFSPVVPGQTSESLLAVAWHRRWIILICVVLALAAGLACIQTATPIYTSTSRLYLEYVNTLAITSELGRLPQTERYLQTQAALLKSRPIVASAIQMLEQQRLQTFRELDIPVAFVAKNIRVEVGKREDVISIAFDSPYPVEAAQIGNSVVEAYMASRSEQEQRNAGQVLEILQKDLSRVEKERLRRQDELEDFQANDMALALGSEAGGAVMQRHLEDLQAGLTSAQTVAMEAESFRDAVKALAGDAGAVRQYVQVKGSVSGYLSSTAEKSPLETRLVELDLQIGELLDKLTPDHPMVATVVNQRAAIKMRLNELDERFVIAVVAAAEQRCSEAKNHEQQFAALYDEQREQLVAVSAEVAQYQRLRSEVDRLAQYAQTLEQQVGEIARIVNEDVGQLRMAILEPALPAEDPSSPQKGRIMAIALVLGLVLGGGIAMARDWLDQTLRSTEEISALLGLRVLGSVPAMPRRRTIQERGRIVRLQPDSHEAEAFRTVRTAVFFSAPHGKAKTMLITSPAAGDGKSTLVSNLAIAMAHAGQKTLILDADFRKPMQYSIFGLDQHQRCLSNVFAAGMKLGAAIQPTGLKGLHVLTCGHGISNPAEVLNSQQFALLLKRLAGAYDRILVDAPPVTVVTDAQILGALCDVTLLVLKADKSTRKAAQRAVEALRSVDAQVLGVVVNDTPKSGDRYGYYYGHYRGHYGSDSGNGDRDKPQRASAGAGEEPRKAVGQIARER